ncbi:fibronectin type III [Myroides sp. WP-1]|uniref:fibronectin type III n=1 Tax=Myroides sp. WP-1 TaxID=2759944 RepID=UPI0015F8DC27|nr:fibronectin type III [Myroides sp. WP-1]MBB1140657.1 fibronectin type III [Myroides sp. WP-1]
MKVIDLNKETNRTNTVHKIIVGVMLLLSALSFAQDTSEAIEQPMVKIAARAQEDAVLLRWGVTTPSAWRKAKENGYVLYRRLVKKDGQIIEHAPKETLADNIQPATQELWEKAIVEDKNEYAAVIAQALFGESFQMEDTGEIEDSELGRIINTAEEIDQRFLFSLYAADMSFEASLLAGWGYIDRKVKKGEEYIYQVEVRAENSIGKGATLIGVDQYEPLPMIEDFIAMGGDKNVLFGWSATLYRNVYVSYVIEKSEQEEGPFFPLSERGIVDLHAATADSKQNPLIYYADTLAINNKAYYYRIYGISSFGEKGQVSKPIVVKGIVENEVAPVLQGFSYDNQGGVELFWDFPKEKEADIKGFELEVATSMEGGFTRVGGILDKTKRSHKQKDLEPSNYFKVAAIGLNDRKVQSMSVLVQPIDSIPPAIPTGLQGQIDSLGVVRLTWNANTEKDLLGYRIIRGQQADEDFVDVFRNAYPTNQYIDSVNLKFSNKKVYYRIAAEDKRHNVSEFSEVLVLEKPTTIPPIAPIFINFELQADGVVLFWENSSSEDVDLVVLSRRKRGEVLWQSLAHFSEGESSYTDQHNLEPKQEYEYQIQAKNTANLWSDSGAINTKITIETLNIKARKVLKNIEAIVDREKRRVLLKWDYSVDKAKIDSIEIYKNEVGKTPFLWKVIKSSDADFILDSQLSLNTAYEYHLLPNVKEGIGKGEQIEVKF